MTNSIIFLGVCERIQRISQPHPLFPVYNIIGLKNFVFMSIFPCNFSGLTFLFAMDSFSENTSIKISGVLPNNDSLFTIDIVDYGEVIIDGNQVLNNNNDVILPIRNENQPKLWTLIPIVPPNDTMLKEPTTLTFIASINGVQEIIGKLVLSYIKSSPLTLDKIDAIKSNPNATKLVRMVIKCNKCSDTLQVYAGLEKSLEEEKKGSIWYEEVPEKYTCSCKTNDLNMQYVRENLFALLENEISKQTDQLEFHRLYEKGVLEKISIEYWKLINKEVMEEKVQVFIEDNPIVLESFHPVRIFHKSPILSKFKTDFTILDNNGYLYLIEIERPNIRLLNKNGEKAADLMHAISQVKDWLYYFDQHKLACLDCLNILPNEVNKVLGFVIGGRDSTYPKDKLAKLKWEDLGNNISFLTYDDLGRNFSSVISYLHQL